MSGPLTGHGFLFSIARQRYVPTCGLLVRLQPEALIIIHVRRGPLVEPATRARQRHIHGVVHLMCLRMANLAVIRGGAFEVRVPRHAGHLSVDGGIACGRYAPPPAVRTWSPPAPCATSAGKPRTSAARATAIHTPRKPIGSHEPVCWQGIRDASAQATDQTDAAGTTDYAAPPAP